MCACNEILFNHESPRRGETFVTRKITRGLARMNEGLEECLYMGNLDSLRDWGHARDYVEMQWRMLQQEGPPGDFVIATGRQESVRRFIELTALALGWGAMRWGGSGLVEVGIRNDTGAVVVRIDPRYFHQRRWRPCWGIPPKLSKNWAGRRPRPLKKWWPRWWRLTKRRRRRKPCCAAGASRWWARWKIHPPTQRLW